MRVGMGTQLGAADSLVVLESVLGRRTNVVAMGGPSSRCLPSVGTTGMSGALLQMVVTAIPRMCMGRTE